MSKLRMTKQSVLFLAAAATSALVLAAAPAEARRRVTPAGVCSAYPWPSGAVQYECPLAHGSEFNPILITWAEFDLYASGGAPGGLYVQACREAWASNYWECGLQAYARAGDNALFPSPDAMKGGSWYDYRYFFVWVPPGTYGSLHGSLVDNSES